MTAKQVIAGSSLYVLWDSVDISAVIRNFDPGKELTTTDTTAGNDEVESGVKVRKKVAPTAEALVTTDTTGDAIMAVLREGHSGVLTWGYEGSTTGKPKWSMDAFLSKANIVLDHAKERVVSLAWMNNSGTMLSDGDDGDTF